MKNRDFPFVVGYNLNTAIVDRKARAQLGRMSVREMADAGLYKAAFCAALSTSDDDKNYIAELYGKRSGSPCEASDLARLFGVFYIPAIDKVKAL